MGVEITVSAKGQIVLPKAMRDELKLVAGSKLEANRTADGILLSPGGDRVRISVDEAIARLRAIVRYDGPPIPTSRLSWSADTDDDSL